MNSNSNNQNTNSHGRGFTVATSLAAVASIALLALACTGVLAMASAGTGGDPAATAAAQNGPVHIEITSPENGAVFSDRRVTVRGTVTPADAIVTLDGRRVASGGGEFVGTVGLWTGRTTVTATASAPGQSPDSATITLSRTKSATKTTIYERGGDSYYGDAGSSDYYGNHTGHAGGANWGTPCGNGVYAGPKTSCPFALRVRAAYDRNGAGHVTVYSPTTRRSYEMYCSGSGPIGCTGGDDASVYF